jgi:hypothetical protein
MYSQHMTRRFPGVDPFIEDQAFWRDFHESFIIYARDAVAEHLPDSYDVRIDERINLMGTAETPEGSFLPDLTVSWKRPVPGWSGRTEEGGVAVAEPVIVPVPLLDQERVSYLEIVHRPRQQLVTTMELLSPSNKEEPGRRDYISKRNAILREPVHLVELDFLLGGRRLPMRSPLPPGDAYAIVSRCETRPDAEVYAWSLRDPLPAIRIPLRAPDPDLVLDLAAVYEETFRRGRYERNLRYGESLQAPLPPAATEWIAMRVNA